MEQVIGPAQIGYPQTGSTSKSKQTNSSGLVSINQYHLLRTTVQLISKHSRNYAQNTSIEIRYANRNLQPSKAPLKSQAQGTSLFTSAAGERTRQIRGVFQRIVHGKLRSGCQKVRGGRLGVKAGEV